MLTAPHAVAFLQQTLFDGLHTAGLGGSGFLRHANDVPRCHPQRATSRHTSRTTRWLARKHRSMDSASRRQIELGQPVDGRLHVANEYGTAFIAPGEKPSVGTEFRLQATGGSGPCQIKQRDIQLFA